MPSNSPEYARLYYLQRKESGQEKVLCSCGAEVARYSYVDHIRTKKHVKNVVKTPDFIQSEIQRLKQLIIFYEKLRDAKLHAPPGMLQKIHGSNSEVSKSDMEAIH